MSPLLDAPRLRYAVFRLRAGFARLRYLRATLWLLPVEAFVLSVLGGVADPSAREYANRDHDVHFEAFIAFNLYLLEITAARWCIGAWEAARPSYSVLRGLALLLWSVALAVSVLMPVFVLYLGAADLGYDRCDALKCQILLPLIPPLITGMLVYGAVLPTSALWLWLARPRQTGATPPVA